MLNKKSAFDVLMNKINKQKDDSSANLASSKSNQAKKLTHSTSLSNFTQIKQTRDENKLENDIILLTNDQNQGTDDIEVLMTISKKSPRKKSQPQVLKHETNFISTNPLLLQHAHQFTEKDESYFSDLKQTNLIEKLRMKENNESDIISSIDLNQPLKFDFTKFNYKLNICSCKNIIEFKVVKIFRKKETDSIHTSKEITFSLNNSIADNDTQTDSSLTLNKTTDFLNDTLNDAFNDTSLQDPSPSNSFILNTTTSSSTTTRRHSKRRKTDSIIEKKSPSDQDQLWTEKYQFKNEDDIVSNNSQLERLKEWLLNWKSILSNDFTSSKKPNDNDDSDSDYSYDSDHSNADSISSTIVNGRKFYSNAILLSGPYGSGKTSSIYSVAKQLGFKVFEVNASSLRCKSQIIQDLEGALNSHHVSNNKQETTNFKMDKFFKSSNFPVKPAKPVKAIKLLKLKKNIPGECLRTKSHSKKRKNSLRREVVLSTTSNRLQSESNKSIIEINSDSNNEDEEEILDQANPVIVNETQQVNIHKESLILFDEIDVVFREDVGFWAAINHFIKRSKKPIVLTTNDDFLQEKINLNIEKIEFIRPRMDSSIKFLKRVAKAESTRLDTPTAFKILRECKCDMRRALYQLQALISSSQRSKSSLSLIKKYKSIAVNSTLNLNKFLSECVNLNKLTCVCHNEEGFFNNMFFLDQLTSKILKYLHLESSSSFNPEQPVSFKKYDLFLLKDGLTDTSSASSSASFNPFLYQQTNELRSSEDLTKLNTTFLKENLADFYDCFMCLFNERKKIEFLDWSSYGSVNEFNFASNVSINRLAQSMFKFTSNRSLCLEYRPYLQRICKYEEVKQAVVTSKRRFIHYLTYLNLGLLKEDFSLLARSGLVTETLEDRGDRIKCEHDVKTMIFDSQIFSDEK